MFVTSVSNAMLRARANLRPHFQYNCIVNQVQIRSQIILRNPSLPKNGLIALWNKITRFLECPSAIQNCPRNVERSSSSEYIIFDLLHDLPFPHRRRNPYQRDKKQAAQLSGGKQTKGQWPYRPAATRAMRNRHVNDLNYRNISL